MRTAPRDSALATPPPVGALMFDSLLEPKAMLVSWVPNVGRQANAGISGSLGYIV